MKAHLAATRTTCPACGATRPEWVTECGKCVGLAADAAALKEQLQSVKRLVRVDNPRRTARLTAKGDTR